MKFSNFARILLFVLSTAPTSAFLQSTRHPSPSISSSSSSRNVASAELHQHPLYEDTLSLNRDLRQLAKSKDPSDAQRANDILDEAETWYTSKIILDKNVNVDDVNEDDMSGPIPDVYSYTNVINAWSRAGKSDKALEILQQMEDMASNLATSPSSDDDDVASDPLPRNMKPNTITYNSVINSCTIMDDGVGAQKAEEILRKMLDDYNSGRNEKCQPNSLTYNIVMKKWALSGRTDAAKMTGRYLEEMWNMHNAHNRQSGQSGPDEFSPDQFSYSTIISAWSRCRQEGRIAAGRAERYLRDMERYYHEGYTNLRPSSMNYSSVIHAWAQCGEAEKAEAVLKDMDRAYREEGNQSARPTAVSYNSVVNAWAKCRDHQDSAIRAMDILDRMETLYQEGDSGVKPDIFSYTSVIDAFAKQGTEEAAQKAQELLVMIESRYEETKDADIKPNVRTYTSVINAISRSKERPQKAEALLDRIEDENNQIDVVCYNALLNAWGWSSETDKAQRAHKIFQRMVELHASGVNPNAKPDLISLNSLLNACAFTDNRDKDASSAALDIAISTYEMCSAGEYGTLNHLTYGTMLMIFNKLLPRNDLRTDLMKNICYQCCQSGNLSGFVVTQLIRGLPTKDLKDVFGKAVVTDKMKKVRIDKRRVPKEWSRNEIGGSKSRPSRRL